MHLGKGGEAGRRNQRGLRDREDRRAVKETTVTKKINYVLDRNNFLDDVFAFQQIT